MTYQWYKKFPVKLDWPSAGFIESLLPFYIIITNGIRSNVSGCLRITTVAIMNAGWTRYNENPMRSTIIHNKLTGMFIVDSKLVNL